MDKQNFKIFISGLLIGILMIGIAGLTFLAIKKPQKFPVLSWIKKPFSGSESKNDNTMDLDFSFELEKDARFFTKDGQAQVKRVAENATEGKYSLMVEFPTGDDYPGIFWEVFGADAVNWEQKNALSFDVFNGDDSGVELHLKIKSGRDYPKRNFERQFQLSAKEVTTIRVGMDEMASQLDLKNISYIKLYVKTPYKTANLYFDRMTTKAEGIRAQAAHLPQSTAALSTTPPPSVHTMGNTLKLSVDPSQVIRPINPLIYGSNLDPKAEFEMDVAKFGKDLGITNFRFPGGVMGYHWRLGTSDINERANEAPLSKMKYLLDFCKIVGTKLVLQVNVESGTSKEAAEWVKYMNQEVNFRVDYWELGNEVYGEWDPAHMTGEKYADVIKEYAAAMKAVDPTIKIGANFGDPNFEAFDRALIKNAADYIDFISYHWYPNHINKSKKYKERIHPTAEELMGNSPGVVTILNRINRMIEELAPQRKGQIEIGFLEWDGSWDAASSDPNYEFKGMMWSLANAIFYADTFGHFAHHGVTMSHHYTFQEVMFGLIRGWDRGAGWGGSRWDAEVIRPKAFSLKLFARHFGDLYIQSELTGSPTYTKEQDWRADSYTGTVNYVEAYTSKFSQANELAIVITNKHAKLDFPIEIDLKDVVPDSQGLLWVINGPYLEAQNDGSPGLVTLTDSKIEVGQKFTYVAPAHSVSLIGINLEKNVNR